MNVIIYILIMIGINFIWGTALLKIIGVKKECYYKKGYIYCSPLIGAVGAICISQMLCVFMPVKTIASLSIVVTAVCLFYIKDILKNINSFNDKYLIILFIFAIVLFAFPLIEKNELFSIQKLNNDIMYYLSSMEWLQNHTLLDKVDFTKNYPFYSLADFMVTKTRFGADILGSLYMSLFGLEAHEVFTVLTITFVIITNCALVFLAKYTLKLSSFAVALLLFLSFISDNWIHLIMYQYMPQILGIGCLLLFTAFMLKVNQNDNKVYIFLTAISISGTLTIYSEYAIYLFCIFICTSIFSFIKYSTKTGRFKSILPGIIAGLLSLVLNPVGTYIALKFNLRAVFDSNFVGDPYNGKVLTAFEASIKSFGLINGSDISIMLNKLKIENLYSQVMIAYLILIIIFLALILYSIIYLFKDRNELVKQNFVVLIGLFIVFELMFNVNKFAYGEFKHIITMFPFVLLLLVMSFDQFTTLFNNQKLRVVLYSGVCIVFICSSLANWSINYRSSSYYVYDDQINQLREKIAEMDINTPIGVDFRTYESYHRILYALKDFEVQINKEPSASYYHFYQTFDETIKPKYIVKDYNSLEQLENKNEKLLWHNPSFALFEESQYNEALLKPKLNFNDFSMSSTSRKTEYGEIINNGAKSEYVFYGPYINLDDGIYDVTIEYDVMQTNGNTDEVIGFADVNSKEFGQKIKEPLYGNARNVTLKGVVIKGDTNIEFRAFVNAGIVCKFKNIQIIRVSK